jgi:hypothetical protein
MKNQMTWPQHLEAWTSSGLTKRAYCEKNNLNYQMFFYHQKKSQVQVPDSFQEVELTIPEDTNKIEYHFPDGGCLVFPVSSLTTVLQCIQPK